MVVEVQDLLKYAEELDEIRVELEEQLKEVKAEREKILRQIEIMSIKPTGKIMIGS